MKVFAILSNELVELVKTVCEQRAETQTLECKAAHTDCPKRLYDTLSSFSNQDSGGVLLFGIIPFKMKYLGWYDANPVNLDPLPPSDAAKKLVEYLGSTELVLCKAKKDYAKGEYQWVAQITKELVFADPSNQKARNLCADALEQLGYQAESGAWRNAYLMGAAELRNGNLSGRARTANGLTNSMRAMTVSMLLDYIAILTDANAAQNDDLTLNLTVTDENEQFYVTRKNGVLLSYPGENHPDAQASVTCKRLQLFALMTGQQAGQVQISGDPTVLKRLLAYASKFEKTFNVIEP